MALASALARDGMRPASFVPTIKCSDCAQEIEISDMGTHICKALPPSPPLDWGYAPIASNPFTLGGANASEQYDTTTPQIPMSDTIRDGGRSSPPPPPLPTKSRRRSSKQPLPMINSEAANRPYLAPRKMTVDAPLSPMSTGKPHPARSLTTGPRLFDPRPPSPEFSANLDCAFPPFPGPPSSARRPSTASNGRNTPNSSERAPSRGASRMDQVLTVDMASYDMAPKSPRMNGGENVLQRMQMLQAGPFTASRRGSNDDASAGTPAANVRQASEPTPDTPPFSGMPASVGDEVRSFTTGNEDQTRTEHEPANALPTRPERHSASPLSPTFLAQFSDEPASLQPVHYEPAKAVHVVDRSNTFPTKSGESEAKSALGSDLSKMRSEPDLRSVDGQSLGSIAPPEQLSALTYTVPPRKDSANSTRMDHRIRDAPPVPRTVQQHQQEGSHTPSDSASSMASMTNSTYNSNLSNASAVESLASSLDSSSPLSFLASKYDAEEKPRPASPSLKNPMEPGVRAEQSLHRAPSRRFAQSTRAQDIAQKNEVGPLTPLESPMDPLLQQMQRRHEAQTLRADRPPLTRTQAAPGVVPKADVLAPAVFTMPVITPPSENEISSFSSPERSPAPPPATSWSPSPSSVGTPPTPHAFPQRTTSRRPTHAKAPCRGCGFAIEGKSVKAADGRLTGRWHKECFVCRTCNERFTTADFYVIKNEPYCEHHYHEHNGSLCKGCNRGIEGQYLEMSSSTRYGPVEKKFHPRCFTCSTCRVVLSKDYFEITGRIFCERHALAAMRAQAQVRPGLHPPDRRGLMAERRTTRLINPMMA